MHEVALEVENDHRQVPKGKMFPLPDGRALSIGRAHRADVRLDVSSVSWKHAVIKCEGYFVTLEEWESSTGTWVEGEKLVPRQPRQIVDGQRIQLGHITLRVVILRSGAAEPDTSRRSPPSLLDEILAASDFGEDPVGTEDISGVGVVRDELRELRDEISSTPAPAQAFHNMPARSSQPAAVGSVPLEGEMRRVHVMLEDDRRFAGAGWLSENVPALIGRAVDASVRVEDLSVSWRHAEICWSNAKFLIRDLGSTNGTFIDRVRIHESRAKEIRDGDLITLGTAQYHFRVGQVEESTSTDLAPSRETVPIGRQLEDPTPNVIFGKDLDTERLVVDAEAYSTYSKYESFSEEDAFIPTKKTPAVGPMDDLEVTADVGEFAADGAPIPQPIQALAATSNTTTPQSSSFHRPTAGYAGQALAYDLRPSPSATPPLPHLETSGVPGRGDVASSAPIDSPSRKGAIQMAERSPTSGLVDTQRRQIVSVLQGLTNQSSALEQFRAAYEYRRQLQWLGESGRTRSMSGLASALAMALESYVTYGSADHNGEQVARTPVDDEFRSQLLVAVDELPSSVVGSLFHSLQREKLDARDPQVLRDAVITAFHNYGRRARSGTSPDPW